MKTPPRFGSLLLLTSLLGALTLSSRAHAESLDDDMSDFAADVMANEYAHEHFSAARKKLDGALKKCGKKRCSREVRAELQRDLGVVYFALGKQRLGRRAFQRAIQLDRSGHLEPDLATAETSAVFRELGGQVGEADSEADVEPEEVSEDDSDSDASSERSARPSAGHRGPKRGWFSLGLQQDLLLHRETRPVCGSADYTCFSGGSEYAGAIWPGYGNQIKGGLALATRRVLLGFDWLLGENFQLGARVGVAFGGGPGSTKSGKFMPAHVELRAAYYFGSNPFERAGVRPYFAIGAGLAEVQGKLAVDFYRDAAAYNQAQQETLEAWRTTGRGFIAPTLGAQFAFSRNTALSFELRMMAMLGTSGLAPAGGVAFVQGL